MIYLSNIKKSSCLILFCICFNFSFSQIKITELYVDTPYGENFSLENHHLGEYIELYNYSDEDIALKSWSLSDKVSRFDFPDNLVLPSEGFIVVVYKSNTSAGDYFPSFFPSTLGKEAQIIYQDKIILRNPEEIVKLNMGMFHGIDFGGFTISEATSQSQLTNANEEQGYMLGPEYVNYYINSYHFNNGTYTKYLADPLYEANVPPTQSVHDIVSFQEAVLHQLTNFTWEQNAQEILDTTCPVTISEISQSPGGTYTEGVICFDYDLSGNYKQPIVCETDDDGDDNNNQDDDGYTQSELEDIASKIIIYPNPTSGIVNMAWDASVDGKIAAITAASTTGGTVSCSMGNLTAACDLTSYADGIYIINFALDSGQNISKIVIKN